MGKYVEHYCSNDYKELRKIIDNILARNFSHVPQMDYDDFYSIGGQVVWQCEMNFDESKGAQFETFLTGCLANKIKTRITYSNRKKRNNGVPTVSMNKLIEEDENYTLEDLLKTKSKTELLPITQRYLDGLSKKQREIADLIIEGYDIPTIKRITGISTERFNLALERMREQDKNKELLDRMKEIVLR